MSLFQKNVEVGGKSVETLKVQNENIRLKAELRNDRWQPWKLKDLMALEAFGFLGTIQNTNKPTREGT